MKKPKKPFEPDMAIGRPCQICGSTYMYRITFTCTKCKKKVVYNATTPAEAIAWEAAAPLVVCPKCKCNKMKSRRWRTHEHHHVSYRHDKTVLVCYQCHQRMHGNAVITSHPFKKEYQADIEPFVFAAHVTSLYIQALPELEFDEPEPEPRQPSKLEKKLNKTAH